VNACTKRIDPPTASTALLTKIQHHTTTKKRSATILHLPIKALPRREASKLISHPVDSLSRQAVSTKANTLRQQAIAPSLFKPSHRHKSLYSHTKQTTAFPYKSLQAVDDRNNTKHKQPL
jgi:hypothetical protein